MGRKWWTLVTVSVATFMLLLDINGLWTRRLERMTQLVADAKDQTDRP